MLQIRPNEKLVIITREDLTQGQQVVQAAHAAIDFTFEHSDRASPWHEQSNYLAILGVKDENALKEFIERCKYRFLKHTVFKEPDLNNSITAIAIEPCKETQKLVRGLKLLFESKTT